jgi:quercetin dioxygenase-like cupin family protein
MHKEAAMRRPLNFRPVGIELGMIGTQVLSAQQTPLKVALLLQTDVVGMEGKEVVVQFSEFAPRATSGKHSHPGHEVAYVLEGSGTRDIEGMPPVTARAGDVFYIPSRKVHETKNASTTDPLKLLVFRIHEKGQPITVRIEDLYFWK